MSILPIDNEKILVSVLCACYNHENYIRDALENFVNQKTSFKYEVIVHDDASTDNSAEIIREYEKKYPDIIKPIYQTENQFSQGVKYVKEFMLPKASGKYFALCEGDDYWTNENKLQKQVDFLESHPEFSVCVHNTEIEFLNQNKTVVRYPTADREINIEDVFSLTERYHTSSIVVRRELYVDKPLWVSMVRGIGDLPSSIYYAVSGRIMYFGDVMSHYRYGVPGSWTDRYISNYKKQIADNKNIIMMLKAADKYYNYKYRKIFFKQILKYRWLIQKVYMRKYFPFLVSIKKFYQREE